VLIAFLSHDGGFIFYEIEEITNDDGKTMTVDKDWIRFKDYFEDTFPKGGTWAIILNFIRLFKGFLTCI
jgi:hypothetical protein